MNFLKLSASVLIFLLLTSAASFAQSEAPFTLRADSVDLKVKGITCSMDLRQISDKVEAVAGVSRCEVLKEGAVSLFRVTYDSDVASEDAIYRAVENTGGCENPEERPYKVKNKTR